MRCIHTHLKLISEPYVLISTLLEYGYFSSVAVATAVIIYLPVPFGH